jgi:hypothetical protein
VVVGICTNKCWIGHKSEWEKAVFFFEVVGGIVLEGFDNGSCNCWEVQAGEEDWEWLIWRALFRYCLHSMLLLSFLCVFFFFFFFLTTLFSLLWW